MKLPREDLSLEDFSAAFSSASESTDDESPSSSDDESSSPLLHGNIEARVSYTGRTNRPTKAISARRSRGDRAVKQSESAKRNVEAIAQFCGYIPPCSIHPAIDFEHPKAVYPSSCVKNNSGHSEDPQKPYSLGEAETIGQSNSPRVRRGAWRRSPSSAGTYRHASSIPQTHKSHIRSEKQRRSGSQTVRECGEERRGDRPVLRVHIAKK
nr:hypothetical protein Iba_chr07eCG0840 [Ipomoea batatas]